MESQLARAVEEASAKAHAQEADAVTQMAVVADAAAAATRERDAALQQLKQAGATIMKGVCGCMAAPHFTCMPLTARVPRFPRALQRRPLRGQRPLMRWKCAMWKPGSASQWRKRMKPSKHFGRSCRQHLHNCVALKPF